MGICWQVMILVANVDISLCMYHVCYKRDYLCLDSDPIWWWHPFTLVLLEQPEVYLSLHSLSQHVYKMLAEYFHDCDYGVGMAMNSWSLGWSTFMGSCHGIFQQQFGLNWLMIMTMIWRSWQDQYMIDQLIMTIMISHLSLLRAALDLPPLPPLLPESDWELDGINSKIEMGAQFHLYIYCIVVLNLNISPSLLTAFSAWLFIIFRISLETHAKSPKTLTEIQSWSPSFTIYTSTMFRFFPGNV